LERTEIDACFWHAIPFGQLTQKSGTKNFIKEATLMGTAIEYQKLMMEIVYINLPGPPEPQPQMSGGELLHGFLAELYRLPSAEAKSSIMQLCDKWNIHYRTNNGK
jgi:hypothetical protein